MYKFDWSQKGRQKETLKLDEGRFGSSRKRMSRLLALHETASLEKCSGFSKAKVKGVLSTSTSSSSL